MCGHWCLFFKQQTAYEWRISDWSSDVGSSDLPRFCSRPPLGRRLAPRVLLRSPRSIGIDFGEELAKQLFLDSRHNLRGARKPTARSEEHTSELQSLMRISYAVFCLKKKNHE